MPSLRDLKKRLQSVKTTGQLAGAMRTVSTAKYSRIGSVLADSLPYSEMARRLLIEASAAEKPAKKPASFDEPAEEESLKPLFVLISGNRGLCGGYNHELFNYFTEVVSGAGEYETVVCGRMAADFCREKKLPVRAAFPVSDVPEFHEAKALSEYLLKEFEGGGFSSVTLIFQRAVNMLKQEPDSRVFLPAEEEEGGAPTETEFIPDAETVLNELRTFCLSAEAYSLLLSCASGAQAATIMAMRAAYDNAKKQTGLLETAINRRRQSEVTQSVLETSSDTTNR